MEHQLLRFARYLRQAGMKIALSEITDALRGISQYGIAEERKFYQLLRATMLKDEVDQDLFDMAYRIFFRMETEKPKFIREMPEEKPCDGEDEAGNADGSGQGKAGMGAASTEFYTALKKRKLEKLMDLMDKQFEDLLLLDSDLEELLKKIKVRMEWFMVENAIDLEGPAAKDDKELLEEMETYLRQRLEKRIVEERKEEGVNQLLDDENLFKKDFTALNEDQCLEMERRIVRLANKLAARYSYRLKPSKSGQINMRKLLMEAGKKGYTPEKMFYLNKVKNKPSMVIFCDISGSVSVYSAFLLQLVYSMTRCFKDIRTFLYVDEIEEATLAFKENTVQEAVKNAIRYVRCSRLGISNYGQVFELFRKEYGDVLHKKTTLLILGDAKNNWYPPREEELAHMKSIVERIIWLNPDPRDNWNQDDSIISTYAPYCNLVLECRNLEQFEQAMKQVI